MALHTPNEFLMQHCDCHVCGKQIVDTQHAIEHSGAGQYSVNKQLGEGYVSIWLHPECATVLMLRLANDVMRIRPAKDQPPRVVDVLQQTARNKLSFKG